MNRILGGRTGSFIRSCVRYIPHRLLNEVIICGNRIALRCLSANCGKASGLRVASRSVLLVLLVHEKTFLSERAEYSSKSADLRLGADKASLNYGTFFLFQFVKRGDLLTAHLGLRRSRKSFARS